MDTEFELDIPGDDLRNIFGQLDKYLKKIEKTLNISVTARDKGILIRGTEVGVKKAEHVFGELYKVSAGGGNEITEQNVDYLLSLDKEDIEVSFLAEIDKELLGYTISG